MLKTPELVDEEDNSPGPDDENWTVEVEGTPSRFPWLAKLGLGLAGFLVMMIAVIAFAPALAPPSMTIGFAEKFISRIAGSEVRIDGEHSLRIFPLLRLEASRIRQADPNAPLKLTINSLEVEASALGALAGSVEIETLVLGEPKLQFAPHSDEGANPSADTPHIDRAWGWWRDMTLKSLVIENADLRIVSGTAGHQYVLERFNVSNQPGADGGTLDGIVLTGKGFLNGKEAVVRLTTSDPQLLVQGNRWPIKMELMSALLNGEFAGALSIRERALGEGKISIRSDDFQALEAWLGPILGVREASHLTIVTDINFADDDIDARQIEISYGQSSIVGGLKLHGILSNAPTVEGSFTAASVDFGMSRAADAFAFTDLPLDGAGMPTGHIDITWQQARWQDYRIGRGKLSVERSPQSKRLTVNLDDTELYGGSMRATMTIDVSEGMRAMHTQIKAVGVEIGAFLKAEDVDGAPILSGNSSLDVNLFSVGGTSKQLIEAMTGDGKLIAQRGILAMPDLLSGIAPEVGSSLPYQTLNASFKVAQGIASSEDLLLRAKGLSLVGKGKIDFADWLIDLDVGRLGLDGDTKTLQRYRVNGSPSQMKIEAIN